MIRLINGAERAIYPHEMGKMFQLRKRVFHDRLGWDVEIKDGWECDRFDKLNPLYVLSMDELGHDVLACLRLLPTTGPNMLCDEFPQLLANGLVVRSPTIWESSRFCVDQDSEPGRSANNIARTTAELMCAVGEIGLASGLSHIVTVTDLVLERIFRRMGCPGERLGEEIRIGKTPSVAIYWEMTEQLLATMKSVAGIEGRLIGGNCSPLLALKAS